jgi:exodeoxyribonuclease III
VHRRNFIAAHQSFTPNRLGIDLRRIAFIHSSSFPRSRSIQTRFSVSPFSLMSRRSSRAAAVAASSKISDTEDEKNGSPGEEVEPKKKSPLKGSAKLSDGESEKPKAKKQASPKKSKGGASAEVTEEGGEQNPVKESSPEKRASKGSIKNSDCSAEDETKPPKKKAKAADHQRWTERTPLTRHWDPKTAAESGSYTFTVISWNVAGLRTFIKKNPDAFANLAKTYDADVICLQETKLQEDNLVDPKLKLKEYFDEKLVGYECHFSCSVEKKGYSGTAMFIKQYGDSKDSKKGKKQATLGAFFGSKGDDKGGGAKEGKSQNSDIPVSNLHPVTVVKQLGLPAHDGEGRTITAEFPLFYLTNVYVPNSGQKLDRLEYRTTQWDNDFVTKMQELEKAGGKPIVWLGDLNVAYDDKDTWNEGAKHLAKSAGTTPEERASFAEQLSAGFVDAFRHLHPESRGHYSYWSQRAGNREPNKGLRLDYFICSKDLMLDGDGKKVVVRDSYMIHDMLGSDHCPIVLVRCICFLVIFYPQ